MISDFVQKATAFQGGIQVISQLRSTQLVHNKKGLLIDVKSHFEVERAKATCKSIFIRGGKKELVVMNVQKL